MISDDEKTFDVEKYREQLKKGDNIIIQDNSVYKNIIYQWNHNNRITNKQTDRHTKIN
ncbi:hypothetical protein [Aquimarina longa]|uniref:hypothetical protein n=1 Tax=Aquimarina longa TaxID=1080221 RepID=UPI000A67EB60|nr:hypothetical protein [Aquimarina longa]